MGLSSSQLIAARLKLWSKLVAGGYLVFPLPRNRRHGVSGSVKRVHGIVKDSRSGCSALCVPVISSLKSRKAAPAMRVTSLPIRASRRKKCNESKSWLSPSQEKIFPQNTRWTSLCVCLFFFQQRSVFIDCVTNGPV